MKKLTDKQQLSIARMLLPDMGDKDWEKVVMAKNGEACLCRYIAKYQDLTIYQRLHTITKNGIRLDKIHTTCEDHLGAPCKGRGSRRVSAYRCPEWNEEAAHVHG